MVNQNWKVKPWGRGQTMWHSSYHLPGTIKPSGFSCFLPVRLWKAFMHHCKASLLFERFTVSKSILQAYAFLAYSFKAVFAVMHIQMDSSSFLFTKELCIFSPKVYFFSWNFEPSQRRILTVTGERSRSCYSCPATTTASKCDRVLFPVSEIIICF